MKFTKNHGFAASLLFLAVIGFAAGTQYPYRHWSILGMGSKKNTIQFDVETPSAGASAILVPGSNNTNALGSSALRFSNVYTTLLNVAGPITASAGVGIIASTAPRTAVGVAALYSSYTIPAGTQFYDSTDLTVCIATGTTQTSIAVSSITSVACPS